MTRNSGKLVLPLAPSSENGAVKAWREAVEMPSYLPYKADIHPMFLDKRVYQGSSGKVYPLPVIDRIASEPVLQSWDAIHIENEFLRVMVLPQIGGRIHIGYDKTNGYDFFYRQNVIKPALVGLAGPWISGGVEFNWPQHHRPDTFMPVDTEIERHPDGSITVWCSQQDSLSHMKGMHGVCLHPGRALIELKGRLYNQTEQTQTFLWWANVATRVHEKYQSFFPPDVRYVADHARRAITAYPLSDRPYYGVDYPARAANGVPASEAPAHFVPDGSYPANDLGWYANIPVPTSYMITSSKGDFLGGYDHAAHAGLVHVANHYISPGKKQWTWGNHEFGYSWDRCLTDEDGPYIELMAGVYTDNQPDFSWLAPGELRSFEQYWYPIREIGVPQAANTQAALSLRVENNEAIIGICLIENHDNVRVLLEQDGKPIAEWMQAISVGQPLVLHHPLIAGSTENNLAVAVTAQGKTLLRYAPAEVAPAPSPEVATEPDPPEQIESNDELYYTGVHLFQYRHATRSPEPYWREALRRDPMDTRCNTALGGWHLRRGEFQQAEEHLRRAIQRMTSRNANPYDGEAFYLLGLTLRYQNKLEDAYAMFYKATWNAAWRAPAFYAIAEIDGRRAEWNKVLQHTTKVLEVESRHLQARALRISALRKLDETKEASCLLSETIAIDPLYSWARFLSDGSLPASGQDRIELALDMMRAGLWKDAEHLLQAPFAPSENEGAAPILLYLLAAVQRELGEETSAKATATQAASTDWQYCFPNRLDEMVLLQEALRLNPDDHRAALYLGTMYYDLQRPEDAIAHWEIPVTDDSFYSVAQRNLGIAYYNVRHNAEAALTAYEKAFHANPTSGRLLYERDQLWKRVGKSAIERLKELEKYPSLIVQRDDLSIELATLYNQSGEPEKAFRVLQREFQPWEGGEGLVLSQYLRASIFSARNLLSKNEAAKAVDILEAALTPPHYLGETFHLLANRGELFYWLGRAHHAAGNAAQAQHYWELAASKVSDFLDMAVNTISRNTLWSALSLRALGRSTEADDLFRRIDAYARELAASPSKIDYFATSLPTMLLFHEDLTERDRRTSALLHAQSLMGLGQTSEASTALSALLEIDPNQMDAIELLRAKDLLS